MSLASLITTKPVRTRFRDVDGKFDILIVDVTTSETPTLENEITENPVEQGPDINDHVRAKPVTITIEGMVSETPLTLSDDYASATGNSSAKQLLGGFATSAGAVVGKALGGGYASTVGAIAGGQIGANLLATKDNQADIARTALETMATNKVLITLVTKRKKYKNMLIQKLTFPRDSASSGALRFSATLKEMNIIQTASVPIGNIKRNAAAGAATKNMGNQSPTDGEGNRKSILKQGLDAVTSKLGGLISLGGPS